jgi:hypothetical protein
MFATGTFISALLLSDWLQSYRFGVALCRTVTSYCCALYQGVRVRNRKGQASSSSAERVGAMATDIAEVSRALGAMAFKAVMLFRRSLLFFICKPSHVHSSVSG